jgi:hypothetical protein
VVAQNVHVGAEGHMYERVETGARYEVARNVRVGAEGHTRGRVEMERRCVSTLVRMMGLKVNARGLETWCLLPCG